MCVYIYLRQVRKVIHADYQNCICLFQFDSVLKYRGMIQLFENQVLLSHK